MEAIGIVPSATLQKTTHIPNDLSFCCPIPRRLPPRVQGRGPGRFKGDMGRQGVSDLSASSGR